MPTYLITQVWKHTETLAIEAESKADALAKALHQDFERNHDDVLYDETVKEIEQ